MYHKYVEISRAVNTRHQSTSGKAKTLWKVREAKAKGDAYYDERQRPEDRKPCSGTAGTAKRTC